MLRAQSSTRALFISGLFKKGCTHEATGRLRSETKFIWMKNSWKIPEEPKLFSLFAQRTQVLLCVQHDQMNTLSTHTVLLHTLSCTRGGTEEGLISCGRSLWYRVFACSSQRVYMPVICTGMCTLRVNH